MIEILNALLIMHNKVDIHEDQMQPKEKSHTYPW